MVVFWMPEGDVLADGLAALDDEDVGVLEDGLLRDDQGILVRLDLEDEVAERAGPEGRVGVVEDGFDAELLAQRVRRQVDDADGAPEIAPGKGGDPEDGFLALADAADVLGRDGHDELDLGVVHEGQDAAGPAAEAAHHGVDDVADLGVLRGDDAGEGGLHEGDVEGVLGQVEPGPGLLELGGGRVVGELDLLALLLGDRVLLDQAVHALPVAEGVGVARFGHGHSGLGLFELKADGIRLELGQELALGHAVAGLGIDAGDLAAHLGGDVDLGQGLERPRVGDLLRDPGPLDLVDLDGRGAVGFGLFGRGRGGLLAGDGGGEGGRGERDDDELGMGVRMFHGFLR